MRLTEEQRSVLLNLVTDIRENGIPQRTLGGYAGTGKTTLANYLRQFFPRYAVCAYTGKAANVLRKKGLAEATTIHGRIYQILFDHHGDPYWDLADDPRCEGFIVDEASMVSKDIYDDLMSFNLPMIFIGDHGQLEPIDSKFNLMIAPDYRLEEIHRNANEIAKFAEHIRKGLAARGFKGQGRVNFIGKVTDRQLCEADQVICAFNKTRVEMNNRIRAAMGFTGRLNVGERVMCLRNNRQLGLFNGMQGVVVRLHESDRNHQLMDFEFDGTTYNNIWYDTHQFGRESYDLSNFGRGTPNPFDYAYGITAHKAQGDEWNKVLVVEQKCKNWSHVRWAYTCASRAKEELHWKSA